MPEQNFVYLNGRPFLGRVEEQKRFRAALTETMPPPPGEDLPYVILLYGDGGIGKTTLAQRFKDIAETEPPFEGDFFTLWIDWEDEREKNIALKVGREQISIETVFNLIHTNFLQANERWGRYFDRYQKMVKERREIEKQAAEILTGGGADNEFSRKLIGATTSALATIIRWQVPIGDTGEKLAQQFLEAGVEIGADKASSLRNFMQTRLQARLKAEQYQIFLNPHEQLALALADGIQQITHQKPLIVFFDTYEIVDRTDIWVRSLIKAAGPKLIWVIGGRQNLVKNRQFGQDYFRGYADTFPRRLIDYDMHQLAQDDVAAYFSEIAAPKKLTETEIEAFALATRGIPLAMRTAGEIWQKGATIEEIVGDVDAHTPHQEIVEQMTARYLLHALQNEADRQAIYALALAKGNHRVLQAMLETEAGTNSFDLPKRLQALRRDYAAIHLQEARLHDEPTAYILSHLQQDERRSSWNIQRLNMNAEAALEAYIQQLETELPLLEERCEDEDWVQATLDLTHTKFWLEEQAGWQYFVPRFVEGLAYSQDLVRGLLEVGQRWKKCLSKRGQKRLKLFSSAIPLLRNLESSEEMVKELNRLDRADWLQGEHEKERKAILSWANGLIFLKQKSLQKAQEAFAKTERGLPNEGTYLKQHLGEALDELAGEMMWPDGRTDAIFASEAENLLKKATIWLPENSRAWSRLGTAYKLGKKYDQAIQAQNQAIQLNPEDTTTFFNRGNTYLDLRDFDRALADYNRAIELNPEYVSPFIGRGNTYLNLRDFDRALADYNRAIELNPGYNTAFINRGTTYIEQGKLDDAIADYTHAIQLNPDDASPFIGRGNTYHALGNFDKAIDDYTQAIKYDPEDAIAHASLAVCYRKLGDKAAYEKAVAQAKPLISNASHYNQACFAAICGDVEEAIRLLSIAIEESPRYKGLIQTDPDYDFIRDDPQFVAFLESLE
ncbi:MAG: tetratricopeptide repeat protein [Anaerolineales bacterium]|nr:tetratricopeptide repeat protein [Anaerolineales bacterium]